MDSVTYPLGEVFNVNSETTIDAMSLNDCLHTGPNSTKKIVDMPIRFRMNKYVCVADLSKDYLRKQTRIK